MAVSDTETARFCPECGKAAEANFCKYCGTALSAAERDDWTGVVSEVTGVDDRHGVLPVLWQLLRSPVNTLMRLTEDPNYKGHLTFFLTMLGTKLFVQFAILPRLIIALGGKSDVDSAATIARENLLQYASLLVFLPLGYLIYKQVSSVPRSQRSYYKFSLIGSGLIFTYELVALVITVVFGLIAAFLSVFILPQPVWDALQANLVFDRLYAVFFIVITLVFYAASTRRFWGLSWPMTIGMMIAVLILSTPIYMMLGAIIDATGLVKIFS